MMPDKIYLEEGHAEPIVGFVGPAWNNTKDLENPIEFIRKEALLEWLENKIKIPDVSFINGLTYLAYQDVIEHINEM